MHRIHTLILALGPTLTMGSAQVPEQAVPSIGTPWKITFKVEFQIADSKAIFRDLLGEEARAQFEERINTEVEATMASEFPFLQPSKEGDAPQTVMKIVFGEQERAEDENKRDSFFAVTFVDAKGDRCRLGGYGSTLKKWKYLDWEKATKTFNPDTLAKGVISTLKKRIGALRMELIQDHFWAIPVATEVTVLNDASELLIELPFSFDYVGAEQPIANAIPDTLVVALIFAGGSPRRPKITTSLYSGSSEYEGKTYCTYLENYQYTRDPALGSEHLLEVGNAEASVRTASARLTEAVTELENLPEEGMSSIDASQKLVGVCVVKHVLKNPKPVPINPSFDSAEGEE